ncbi:MAG: hypothetical protein ACLFRY_09800 [Spirochaetia bacterium]
MILNYNDPPDFPAEEQVHRISRAPMGIAPRNVSRRFESEAEARRKKKIVSLHLPFWLYYKLDHAAEYLNRDFSAVCEKLLREGIGRLEEEEGTEFSRPKGRQRRMRKKNLQNRQNGRVDIFA